MLTNFWLEHAMEIVENEVVLVKNTPSTRNWFERMPTRIPAIFSENATFTPMDFKNRIGHAHYMRLSNWGIEGVLKAPRKFLRWQFYVLYDKKQQPNDPFWVIFHQ